MGPAILESESSPWQALNSCSLVASDCSLEYFVTVLQLLSLCITLFLKLDQKHRWLGEWFVLEMAYGKDAYQVHVSARVSHTHVCIRQIGHNLKENLPPVLCQTLNVIVGFLVVFRTQLAYQRYWEGRSTGWQE